jgi:glycosyltransferase involved in cell wall biosynthesis
MVEVLTHLDRRAFSPRLYCLRAEGALLDQVRQLGVPVVDCGLQTLRGGALPRAVVRLGRELRMHGTRVVHSYLFHANLVGTLAARVARVPVTLASKRSLDTYPTVLERWACKLSNRLADRVTANAEEVRRHAHEVEGCSLDKIVVIPNGVDLTRFATTVATPPPVEMPASGPIVGCVGRLSGKKGHSDLLEAAALVLRRRPDTTFVLVGDGALRSELRAQADGLGLNGQVRFVGHVNDPVPLLYRMNLFVLPSRIEGMSNALLEAMAANRAVVATSVGGNPEVVVDGVTGLLVPPRDPARLANAVLTLLADPQRASAMGAAGRARVETCYSVQAMLRQLEDLYRRELARKGALGA